MKQFFIISAIILFCSIGVVAQTGSNRFAANPVKVVRFYPNPATSFINFEFQTTVPVSNYSFKIYNFIGKKVLELNSITSRTVVNLSDYFRGVYIFQLTDRNGQVIESGKFQVAK